MGSSCGLSKSELVICDLAGNAGELDEVGKAGGLAPAARLGAQHDPIQRHVAAELADNAEAVQVVQFQVLQLHTLGLPDKSARGVAGGWRNS